MTVDIPVCLPPTNNPSSLFLLQLKQFDVGDVESLVGRYSHVEHGIKMDGQAYLRQFYNERSLHKRLAMIRQARKGGAVTPEAYIHLQPFILTGQVDVKTYCQVMAHVHPTGCKVEGVVIEMRCGEVRESFFFNLNACNWPGE